MTHPVKSLSCSFPLNENFLYCNTSIPPLKEVKCELRPWQKFIQANFYLRPLKAQIYNTVEKKKTTQDAYVVNDIFLAADSKKLLDVHSKMSRCRGRRGLRYFCTSSLTQERSFGKNTIGNEFFSNSYLCLRKPQWWEREWWLLPRELKSSTSCSTLRSSKNCRKLVL